MRAVKFNLLEKKAAAAVQVRPAEPIMITRDYAFLPVEGRMARHRVSSFHLSPHAPPDRLALYRCYLI
jgi:hypothetical protein